MRIMIERTGTVIKKNTIIAASNSLTPALDLTDKGVSFAFAMTDIYASYLMDDPKYGSYIL
jgi:hypothetical protein